MHGGTLQRARTPFHTLARLVLPTLLPACGLTESRTTWRLDPSLSAQVSGTEAPLMGVSVVDRDTVWVSGAAGTFARTTDGGLTWRSGVVAGADSLQFRDVHALDGRTAYLLSIGPGDRSRIYRTGDAGETWQLQFANAEPDAFLDCFGFWPDGRAIAFGDSFDGRLDIVATDDGTEWIRVPSERRPAAADGEGGFAASGTCFVTHGDSAGWIGTGASDGGARVLRTTDRGRSWSVAQTPIVRGPVAGIATLAFRDATNGAALGGDIGTPGSVTDNVAVTADGGRSWRLAGRTPFRGSVYGAAWVTGAPVPTLLAVGPGGIAFTTDGAVTWTALDTLNHWSVAFAGPDGGWAVGPRGRITRIRMFRREPGGM